MIAVACCLVLLGAGCTSAAESPAPSTTPASSAGTIATTQEPAPTPPTAVDTTPPSSTTEGNAAWTIVVPEVDAESAPAIDGTIEPGEWDGGVVAAMDDGTAVRVLRSHGYVFVSVAGSEVGSVNVLVADGDVVRILHSSAALGSAEYLRMGDEWQLTRDFEWCCRNVGDLAERSALRDAEGWLASTGYEGSAGDVEYQLVVEDGSRIALSYVLRDGTVAVWPPDVDEGARGALFGRRRTPEQFDLTGWVVVRTEPEE